MNSEQAKIITEWIEDARILLRCYLNKAQKIKRLNRVLKILSASLSTLLLTLIFIFIRLDLLDKDIYIIIISVTALISSVLSVIVVFLNLPEDANKCDNSGSQYATIRKELEYLLTFENGDDNIIKSEMKRINQKWDYIRKNSLPITPNEIKKMKAEVKSDK